MQHNSNKLNIGIYLFKGQTQLYCQVRSARIVREKPQRNNNAHLQQNKREYQTSNGNKYLKQNVN